jgi:hypothetical protein
MRLPFPERIPLPAAFIAATVLAGLQQLQGTDLNFSFYSFLFIIIATVAFNLAGGFTRASGSYVFFYAVLGVIVGISYKAFLGEPGESNLRSPILTMQVFTGGITSMLVAVILSRRLTRKKPFLGTLLKERDTRTAAVGCVAVGLLISALNAVLPHEGTTVLSAITQLNKFLIMSVILATLYTIRKSKGRTGFGILVAVTLVVNMIFGLVSFSKEGMFTPLVGWVVAACSLRLRLRLPHLLIGGAVTFIAFHFLVPYSQYGRDLVPDDPTFSDRVHLATGLLSDLGATRELYLANETEGSGELRAMQYYNQSQGFFDRLTMLGADDALIDYTSRGNYFGLSMLAADFGNWVPHFLWPNKPTLNSGNMFARSIGGVVGEQDTSTGISFSPSAEAYQLAGWTGVFLVAPLVWTLVFVTFDSLCGDTRKSPWGLLVVAAFAHVAPEGMLDNAIYFVWFGGMGIIFVALASAYVMPILGTLIVGADRDPKVSSSVAWRRRSVPASPLQLGSAELALQRRTMRDKTS